jgi:mono/diheme cytochrome c family protein
MREHPGGDSRKTGSEIQNARDDVTIKLLSGCAGLLAGWLIIACLGHSGLAADERSSANALTSAVPSRPEDPRAAKAYAVLDTYCARCHQTGKLERPLGSGGLANILDIEALGRDSILVKPGFPDASRLYDVLETQHAPLDVFSGPNAQPEPSPDDVEAVRRWIKELPDTTQTCPSRHPIRLADIDKLMRDAQRLERDQGKDVRFISLVHLYNACATPDEMTAYVAALNKLMNSLSWAPDPVKLTALDAAGTVLSFRLSDFGWDAARWAAIERGYPAALVHTVAADVLKTAGSKAVIVNGDWLAAAAGETPLYYDLLGIPQKLSAFATMNGTKIDSDIRAGSVRRIAVRESAVTRGNRLIERHPGDRGGLWLVYDFATSSGAQNIFDHPLGPKSATHAASPFKADEVRALFALPNGFYAFALYDADGNRIDRVLPGIEKAYAGDEADAVEPTTKAGTNCFSCHTDGLVATKDDFRPAGPIDISSTPMPADRRSALPLFGTDSENALLMLGGTDRYRAAAKAAGVDLGARVHGEELVSGLARRYREGADFEVALGETGLERKEFLNELADAKGPAAPLARRLLHGVLSRAQLEQLFSLLKGIDTPKQTASAGFLREVKSEIGLSMWLDKPRPVPGDLVTVRAEADSDCYLTIISVDAEGVATVLFPSDFQTDNLVTAGTPVNIPPPDAPFQLRYKAEGSETILGRCSMRSEPPVGIEHDFERQRFTVLGNWENFIQDTLVTGWEMRTNPEKAERARIARTGAIQRREAQGERVDPPRPDLAGDRALRDGRAVLVLGIR